MLRSRVKYPFYTLDSKQKQGYSVNTLIALILAYRTICIRSISIHGLRCCTHLRECKQQVTQSGLCANVVQQTDPDKSTRLRWMGTVQHVWKEKITTVQMSIRLALTVKLCSRITISIRICKISNYFLFLIFPPQIYPENYVY